MNVICWNGDLLEDFHLQRDVSGLPGSLYVYRNSNRFTDNLNIFSTCHASQGLMTVHVHSDCDSGHGARSLTASGELSHGCPSTLSSQHSSQIANHAQQSLPTAKQY